MAPGSTALTENVPRANRSVTRAAGVHVVGNTVDPHPGAGGGRGRPRIVIRADREGDPAVRWRLPRRGGDAERGLGRARLRVEGRVVDQHVAVARDPGRPEAAARQLLVQLERPEGAAERRRDVGDRRHEEALPGAAAAVAPGQAQRERLPARGRHERAERRLLGGRVAPQRADERPGVALEDRMRLALHPDVRGQSGAGQGCGHQQCSQGGDDQTKAVDCQRVLLPREAR